MKNTLLATGVAIALVAGTAGVAFASAGKDDEAQEAQAAAQAKVSLIEAIRIAEKRAGGRAVDAGFDDESGYKLYEVEVFKGAAVQKVQIDAQTGKVVKVTQGDEGDGDEQGDRD